MTAHDDQSVPRTMQTVYKHITELTDSACAHKLNDEYAQLARKMTAALCRKRPSPLASGHTEVWAAGILYAIGQVNFLFDKSTTPHLRTDELADLFGIAKSTASAKASTIKQLLKINRLGHAWILPSRVDNWMPAWMIQVNGLYVDARDMPYEIQRQAAAKGMIPYLPKQSAEDEATELCYDAMEWMSAGEPHRAKEVLMQALQVKPGMMNALVGLHAVCLELDDSSGARKWAGEAYEQTLKQFPEWPEDFTWGFVEYRPYLRAICNQACQLHIDGKTEEADALYRLLLQFTPGDNQGVRYLIAGMYAGVSPDDVDRMTDEGNDLQDWSALENMLEEQNAKHHFWVEPKDHI